MRIVLSKFCKKAAAIIIVLLLIMTGVQQAFVVDRRFPDTAGNPAEKYVNLLADKGVISGMPDGKFHPDEEVTTGQFVTMLMRGFFGEIPPSGAQWASGYLDKALSLGIIYDADVLDADAPLIRQNAVRFIYNAVFSILCETEALDVSAAQLISDKGYCRSCIYYLEQVYSKGIISLYPDHMFYGENTFTRADASEIVAKVLDNELREPPAPLLD
jgi:hypothetical protein